MTDIRRIRSSLSLAVAAMAMVAGGSVATSVAGASAKPHLVVTPAKGLKSGSTVKVSGSGFSPKDTLYIVQCVWKAKGSAGCSISSATPVTVSAAGTFPTTKFKVVTGTIGNGTCGTKKSNLNNCEVSVGNAAGGDSATVRIVFEKPKG